MGYFDFATRNKCSSCSRYCEHKGQTVCNSCRRSAQLQEWQPDESSSQCTKCLASFGFIESKHHCRSCGKVFCEDCLPYTFHIPNKLPHQNPKPIFPNKEKVCVSCLINLKHQAIRNYHLGRQQLYCESVLKVVTIDIDDVPNINREHAQPRFIFVNNFATKDHAFKMKYAAKKIQQKFRQHQAHIKSLDPNDCGAIETEYQGQKHLFYRSPDGKQTLRHHLPVGRPDGQDYAGKGGFASCYTNPAHPNRVGFELRKDKRPDGTTSRAEPRSYSEVEIAAKLLEIQTRSENKPYVDGRTLTQCAELRYRTSQHQGVAMKAGQISLRVYLGILSEKYVLLRSPPVNVPVTLFEFLPLLSLLKSIHKEGYFHFDIKPDNIMLWSPEDQRIKKSPIYAPYDDYCRLTLIDWDSFSSVDKYKKSISLNTAGYLPYTLDIACMALDKENRCFETPQERKIYLDCKKYSENSIFLKRLFKVRDEYAMIITMLEVFARKYACFDVEVFKSKKYSPLDPEFAEELFHCDFLRYFLRTYVGQHAIKYVNILIMAPHELLFSNQLFFNGKKVEDIYLYDAFR